MARVVYPRGRGQGRDPDFPPGGTPAAVQTNKECSPPPPTPPPPPPPPPSTWRSGTCHTPVCVAEWAGNGGSMVTHSDKRGTKSLTRSRDNCMAKISPRVFCFCFLFLFFKYSSYEVRLGNFLALMTCNGKLSSHGTALPTFLSSPPPPSPVCSVFVFTYHRLRGLLFFDRWIWDL